MRYEVTHGRDAYMVDIKEVGNAIGIVIEIQGVVRCKCAGHIEGTR